MSILALSSTRTLAKFVLKAAHFGSVKLCQVLVEIIALIVLFLFFSRRMLLQLR
jgi:hypothetical protein